MLVCIQSLCGDRLISGRKCTAKSLEEKMKTILALIERTEDFTPLFCRVYNFEEYPLSKDSDYEFTIELDVPIVF